MNVNSIFVILLILVILSEHVNSRATGGGNHMNMARIRRQAKKAVERKAVERKAVERKAVERKILTPDTTFSPTETTGSPTEANPSMFSPTENTCVPQPTPTLVPTETSPTTFSPTEPKHTSSPTETTPIPTTYKYISIAHRFIVWLISMFTIHI